MISQMVCNIEIDYSTIIGSRILPFTIELDLTKSRLYPEPGENQKFCYNIIGTGSDTSLYADLSHIVFGICNQISKDEITNITEL